MKNLKFNKKVNVTELSKELIAAGFDIYGVSNSGTETIVHLKDTEWKNPDALVAAHLFTEYPKPKTTEERLKELEDKIK